MLLQDLLQRLNRLSGRPDGVLADYFDLMAGTSTGGMIALASGICRKPLSELEELYMTMGKEDNSVPFPAAAINSSMCDGICPYEEAKKFGQEI